MDNSDDTADRRVRTFALITGLPDAGGVTEQHLYQTLRAQTTGAMACRMLPPTDSSRNNDFSHHAIALFESKEAALDAAEPGKVQLVVLKGASSATADADKPAVVTLRILPMQRDRATAPELCFQDTITVEGETVAKDALAVTTGLVSVLKNFSGYRESVGIERGPGGVAKWCNATRRGEDCPRGSTCWFIHRSACQVTVTPKALVANARGSSAKSNTTNNEGRTATIRPRSGGDDEDKSHANAVVTAAATRRHSHLETCCASS
jgi:hypothetical protein